MSKSKLNSTLLKCSENKAFLEPYINFLNFLNSIISRIMFLQKLKINMGTTSYGSQQVQFPYIDFI